MKMNLLKGSKIDQIFVEDDSIEFVTDKGIIRYEVEGECCSESFISDIIGFNKVKGKKIIKIEEIELLDDGRKKRQEEDKIYGYKLITKDEICSKTGLEISNNMIFAFRNSSNGYYGGSLKYGKIVSEIKNNKEILDNYISD